MKSNKLVPALILIMCGALLAGCKSTSATLSDIIIAAPLEVTYRQELHLVRLNEMLSNAEISNDQRARLLYERGVVYDELGLKSLAQYDFNVSVKLKPDLAEAYNFLGVYLTLNSNFDGAYEAFDSAYELNPDYQFTLLSRGIALYYGDRAKLAAKDLQQFLAFSPKDPYRTIWQFIVQSKYDKVLAKRELKENATLLSQDQWPAPVVQLYMSKISEKDFLKHLDDNVNSDQERAQRLCEAYFYLGKLRAINGDRVSSLDFYKLALATNVYSFIEHKYARLELEIN